jgi:hypothetical protein
VVVAGTAAARAWGPATEVLMTGTDIAWLIVATALVSIVVVICVTYLKKPWD